MVRFVGESCGFSELCETLLNLLTIGEIVEIVEIVICRCNDKRARWCLWIVKKMGGIKSLGENVLHLPEGRHRMLELQGPLSLIQPLPRIRNV